MRRPIKTLDNAAAVAQQLGCADIDAALRLLGDPSALREQLAALGWADHGGYLVEQVAPLLSRFVGHEEKLLAAFLSGEADLQQVYPAFLTFLAMADTNLKPEPLLASLGFYEREAYTLLMEELGDHRPRDLVRFLGFGLAQGEYEREIAANLVERGVAGEVQLYGFDPYIDFSGTEIKLWTPSEVGTLSFDLILARWVLHHLEPAARWSSFLAAARCLAPGGWLVLQEEGDFRNVDEWNLADRLLELLLSSVDVLNTLTFVGEWHQQTSGDAPAYYLKHLSYDDIEAIEAGFGFAFERRVLETGPGVFGQTLLVYHRV
jgi:SAM-dependent methyltransferase